MSNFHARVSEVTIEMDGLHITTVSAPDSKEAAPDEAQKPWVGLTDEEVMQTMSGDWTSQFYFARAIEAKLREKNGGAS